MDFHEIFSKRVVQFRYLYVIIKLYLTEISARGGKMRERFDLDELKNYEETYRAAEKQRAEELYRSEEIFRTPEFPSEESSSGTRNTTRRKNMRQQRSLLAGLVSAVGTAAGAVVIVAAVILSITEVTLSSVAVTTHSLQFELSVNWAETSELTAILTSDSEQYEQTFSDDKSSFTLLFDSLTPDTDYHLEITDGTTVFLSEDCRTATPQLINIAHETVSPDSISLVFDGSGFTGIYTVYLDDIACGNVSADSVEIAWEELTPETSYRVTVKNKVGDVVFDKTYLTPAYEVVVTETASEISMTRIYVELNVEHASDTLTAAIAGQSQALTNGVNVIRVTGLLPGTEYTLEVSDENEVYLTRTYITDSYVQMLFPAETVLPESIELKFDSEELTASSYTVMLDGNEYGILSAADTDILLSGLTPETSYRVTIEDGSGNTVFDKTYLTPAYEVVVTETASEISMTRIYVELNVEHASDTLTAKIGWLSRSLHDGKNTIEITGLNIDTEYTLEVSDGETVCFAKTYRTLAYEQKLFPVETVLSESIELQFTPEELTADSYIIKLNGEETGALSATQTVLLFEGLTPETDYRVTIEDDIGNTVFDKTYITVPDVSITEISSEISMTKLRVELYVENMINPLTVTYGGNSQTLQNGTNIIELSGLSPGTVYAVRVTDGTTEYFFQTYRTANYVQTLFPVEQYVGIDTIILQFDEATIPEDGYTVYVNNELYGVLNSSNFSIVLENLTPNTTYHIEVLDSNEDIMLEDYYLTPYLIADVASITCAPTYISLTLFIQSQQGQADVSLRSESGEYYNKIANPENSGEFIFENLTPMTEYTLTITDDRSVVYYEDVLRTELSYSLVSISGTEITLDFPAWQFGGLEGVEVVLNDSTSQGMFFGGEITLSDLTPLTEYEITVYVSGVIYWQKTFTTPDIIVDRAEPIVGSNTMNVTFSVQNPKNETLRAATFMGDIEQQSFTFNQSEFTATFDTIENGLYYVRLIRESDGLILWQKQISTAYSFVYIPNSLLTETEDGDELWEINGQYIDSIQIEIREDTQYFVLSEIRLDCIAQDGSNLTLTAQPDGNINYYYLMMEEITLDTVYELRIYRNVDGVDYLIESLYWKCLKLLP